MTFKMILKLVGCISIFAVVVLGEEYRHNILAVEIEVKCTSNCNPTYLEIPLQLSVFCKGCRESDKNYWSVAPIMGYFDFTRDTKILQNGRQLIIQPNVYKANDVINFMALIYGQSGEIRIIFEEKPPAYYIKCVENCPETNRFLDATFSVVCDPQCKNVQFKWSVHPQIRNDSYRLSPNNETFTILGGTFDQGTNYYIFLEADNVKKNTSITTTDGQSHLHISCKSNCGKYLIYDYPFMLQITCIACSIIYLTWAIDPPIKGKVLINEVEGKYELTIPEYSFLGGVSGTVTVKEEFVGTDSWEFTTKGSCVMKPRSGSPGVTNFTINCHYINESGVNVFQKSDNDSTDPGVLLFQGTVEQLKRQPIWFAPGAPTLVKVEITKFDHTFTLRPYVSTFEISKFVGLETIITNKYFGSKLDHGSFLNAINTKDWNKVIQIAALLTEELRGVQNNEFIRHYIFHILSEIGNHIQSMHYEQVLSLMLMISKNITDAREGHVIAENVYNIIPYIPKNLPLEILNRVTCQILNTYLYISNLSATVNRKLATPEYLDEYIMDYHDFYFLRSRSIYHLKWITYFVTVGLEMLARFGEDHDELRLSCHKEGFISYTKRFFTATDIIVKDIKSYVSFPEGFHFRTEVPWIIQIGLIRPNIFWWHTLGKRIDSEIIMVNLVYGSVQQTFLHHYIDIYIESNSTDKNVIRGNLTNNIAMIYKISGVRGATILLEFEHLGFDYYIYFSSQYPYMRDAKLKGQRVVRNNYTTYTMERSYDYTYLVVHKYLPDYVQYEIYVKMLTCLSWIEDDRIWTNRYCKLGTNSNVTHTHCQCNHLSLFAVQHFGLGVKEAIIMDQLLISGLPSTIPLVFTVLLLSVLIYCLMLFWADRHDKVIERRSIITKPIDTIPGDSHLYLVLVETAGWHMAGTTSTVILQIHGNTSSRRHIISGPAKLHKDSEDWYAIYTPEHLGPIQYIRLFHDSTGLNPHWFCKKITIKHVASGLIYRFNVNHWFSLLKGDGRLHRVISVKLSSQRRSKFTAHLRAHLRQEYILAGVCVRNPASTFTGKERATVVFIFALLTMVTCLLFLGITDLEGWDEKQSLYIAMPEFIVIGQSVLITTFMLALLTSLFRNSKPFIRR